MVGPSTDKGWVWTDRELASPPAGAAAPCTDRSEQRYTLGCVMREVWGIRETTRTPTQRDTQTHRDTLATRVQLTSTALLPSPNPRQHGVPNARQTHQTHTPSTHHPQHAQQNQPRRTW
eukprot:94946-Rhodomonas_salina.1